MASIPKKTIEPPAVINNRGDLLTVLNQVCDGMRLANDDKPTLGMLYLKFKTKELLDKCIPIIRSFLNSTWREELKHSADLDILVVVQRNSLNVADVLFAPDRATVDELAKMRFPGYDFGF